MKVVAVIPARYASSRFPGKAIADIKGKPLIQWVYERISTCQEVDYSVVATDDTRIMDTVKAFGGEAILTSEGCTSGTDRVAEATKSLDADIILNIQGDQIIFDKDAIRNCVEALAEGHRMATIATPLSKEEMADANTVKVVLDKKSHALYFSRYSIPYMRIAGPWQHLKHVGIYGFKRDILYQFTRLTPTPLEKTESLEQLRAIENGIPIYVVISSGEFFEINTPLDRKRFIDKWQE